MDYKTRPPPGNNKGVFDQIPDLIDCGFPAQWSALSTAQDDPLTLLRADEARARIENNTTALSQIDQDMQVVEHGAPVDASTNTRWFLQSSK
jgi:hypothetical protein